MALNLAPILQSNIYIVPPVIDFMKFSRTRREERTCPICGRKFIAVIDMASPNPEQGIYCSHFCLSKSAFKKYKNLVSEKEVKDFIKSKTDLIDKAICGRYYDNRRDYNLSFEDMKQQCYVALYYFLARCKKYNRNPLEYGDKYLISELKHSFSMSEKERNYTKKSVEENIIEDNDDEGIANKVHSVFDIDKQLDIENILRKIYQLAKHNDNVKIALLHALLYEKEKDIENGKVFKDYCFKNFGIKPTSNIWKFVKYGTEHIFYNNYKNISKYIHVNNLKNKYRFNEDYWQELSEDKLGKEIADLLDYYSGYTTCSICGKRFKPDNKAILGLKNPICSDECRLIAKRKYEQNYRERQGAVVGEVTRICSVCGKEFKTTSNCKGKKNVYCSDECRQIIKLEYNRKYRKKISKINKNRVVEPVERVCCVCGKTFKTTNPKLKTRANVFCSDECRKIKDKENKRNSYLKNKKSS